MLLVAISKFFPFDTCCDPGNWELQFSFIVYESQSHISSDIGICAFQVCRVQEALNCVLEEAETSNKNSGEFRVVFLLYKPICMTC